MPDQSSNIPSGIVYSAIGAKSLRIAKASNNPESFSTAVKPFVTRMSRQKVSVGKKQLYSKVDFNNVCQSKLEPLNLVS